MKTAMMFIAGAMFLSTGYGKSPAAKEIMNCAKQGCCTHAVDQTVVAKSAVTRGDPGAEERFRMKYGRYTPREEARREALKIATNEARAKQVLYCANNGCCTNQKPPATVAKSEVRGGDPGAEARFRMKYGRNSAAEESRVAAAKRETREPLLVASANVCEGDCCK